MMPSLLELSYKELQGLAKKHNLRANKKKDDLLRDLQHAYDAEKASSDAARVIEATAPVPKAAKRQASAASARAEGIAATSATATAAGDAAARADARASQLQSRRASASTPFQSVSHATPIRVTTRRCGKSAAAAAAAATAAAATNGDDSSGKPPAVDEDAAIELQTARPVSKVPESAKMPLPRTTESNAKTATMSAAAATAAAAPASACAPVAEPSTSFMRDRRRGVAATTATGATRTEEDPMTTEDDRSDEDDSACDDGRSDEDDAGTPLRELRDAGAEGGDERDDDDDDDALTANADERSSLGDTSPESVSPAAAGSVSADKVTAVSAAAAEQRQVRAPVASTKHLSFTTGGRVACACTGEEVEPRLEVVHAVVHSKTRLDRILAFGSLTGAEVEESLRAATATSNVHGNGGVGLRGGRGHRLFAAVVGLLAVAAAAMAAAIVWAPPEAMQLVAAQEQLTAAGGRARVVIDNAMVWTVETAQQAAVTVAAWDAWAAARSLLESASAAALEARSKTQSLLVPRIPTVTKNVREKAQSALDTAAAWDLRGTAQAVFETAAAWDAQSLQLMAHDAQKAVLLALRRGAAIADAANALAANAIAALSDRFDREDAAGIDAANGGGDGADGGLVVDSHSPPEGEMQSAPPLRHETEAVAVEARKDGIGTSEGISER